MATKITARLKRTVKAETGHQFEEGATFTFKPSQLEFYDHEWHFDMGEVTKGQKSYTMYIPTKYFVIKPTV